MIKVASKNPAAGTLHLLIPGEIYPNNISKLHPTIINERPAKKTIEVEITSSVFIDPSNERLSA